MKIEYLDRTGQHEIDLSNLYDSTNILEKVEQVLASIGRNEASLSKLKGTQYEKRYVNDFAEYQLIKYLCDLMHDKNLKIDELTKSKVDIVTADNSEKDEKINELTKELTNSKTQVDELNNKLDELNNKLIKLQNDYEDLSISYEDAKVYLIERDKNVDDLVKEKEAYVKEKEAYENVIKESNEKLALLKKSYDELNNNISKLKEKYQDDIKQCEKILTDEKNKLAKDVDILTETLSTEKAKYNDSLVKYTGEIDKLQSEINKLTDEKNKILKEFEDLNKEYDNLTKEYTKLKNESDSATEAANALSNVTKEYVNVTKDNLNKIKEQMKQFQKTHPRLGSEMETKWFEI